MESILEVFKAILSQYGITAAILTLVILVIGYIVYIINKNYSESIKKYLENKAAIKELNDWWITFKAWSSGSFRVGFK